MPYYFYLDSFVPYHLFININITPPLASTPGGIIKVFLIENIAQFLYINITIARN